METYIPISELNKRFSVRFRYTRFGLFFFLRSVFRMQVDGRTWQKILFALFIQLLILGLPALIADVLMLILTGIGFLVAELYTGYIRPLLQRLLFGAVNSLWKILSWAMIIILILVIIWHYADLKNFIEHIING